ncbi:hypothetical protein [Streptomyces sp. TLI_146]|uniref:hypothetical protein n=1 Tax=Streptomyces sp. TLI_146 TaxID=1938858 RepID=UPI000C704C44|nr:hypothetical protein [Streptomyces sp. TLI_146]PKV83399.1 hypothetical protein BX283_0901 [Streptomyces sp. TLI_146]
MKSRASKAITDWLASAHRLPSQARREFDVGIVLLPTGEKFDAIRLPAEVVHAAAGGDAPEAVGAFLAETLENGAVIHDAYGVGVCYYALVPPGTGDNWRTGRTGCDRRPGPSRRCSPTASAKPTDEELAALGLAERERTLQAWSREKQGARTNKDPGKQARNAPWLWSPDDQRGGRGKRECADSGRW